MSTFDLNKNYLQLRRHSLRQRHMGMICFLEHRKRQMITVVQIKKIMKYGRNINVQIMKCLVSNTAKTQKNTNFDINQFSYVETQTIYDIKNVLMTLKSSLLHEAFRNN